MKNKYTVQKIVKKFITGTWKNEFSLNEKKGFEICEIRKDGKYFVDGEHWFNIVELKYNPGNHKITFIKKAVKPGDYRQFHNELLIINRHLISGTYYLTDDTKSKKDKKPIQYFSLKYIRLNIR